jgi:hypothetical protein
MNKDPLVFRRVNEQKSVKGGYLESPRLPLFGMELVEEEEEEKEVVLESNDPTLNINDDVPEPNKNEEIDWVACKYATNIVLEIFFVLWMIILFLNLFVSDLWTLELNCSFRNPIRKHRIRVSYRT